MTTDMKPIHPGEVLFEVYMRPATPPLTVEMLARTLHVSEEFLTSFINGQESITPSLAMPLSVICRTTPHYWLQLQKTYDRQTGKQRDARHRRINRTNRSHPAAAA